MEMNYKQTFDAVRMHPERQEQIRSKLSSRFSENEKEDKVINIKTKKRLITVLLAAVLSISLLAAAGFAYGSQIIQMLGGSYIESGRDSNGHDYVQITITDNNPAIVRDGKVFITIDGIEKDITSYCTETTFFSYEKNDEDGNRHVLVIGGTPEKLGWADFVFKESGQYLGGGSVYHASEYDGIYTAGLLEWTTSDGYPMSYHDGKPVWLVRAFAMFLD